ncbi:MAG: metallophosphoesterase family protein [Sarcina sp.]
MKKKYLISKFIIFLFLFSILIPSIFVKATSDKNNDFNEWILESQLITGRNLADTTSLHKYIINAINIDKTRYTKDSLQKFINEVKLSVDVYNDKISTQEDIDNEVEKVKESINILVKKEEPLMSFQLLSDVHTGSTKDSATAVRFFSALEDISINNSNSAALIFTGDITECATEEQYQTFFSILEESNPANNAIVALGNHDVRWSGGYDVVFDRYQRYYLNNINETKPYFAKAINGYTFIVLNTEIDLNDCAHISNKQLNWLDKTLAEQKDKNKPVFIVVHQPLKGTFPNSDDWSIGEQDAQIKHILAKYPQVVYFAGHIHNKFGTTENVNGKTFTMKYDEKYCNMLEVPSLMEHGQGYYVEVFEDKVEFLARDFIKSRWLPEYNQVIKFFRV